MGVITFNLAQQNLIEDLVQKEVSKDSDFESKLNQMSEPIFIKNLENVQGDERDKSFFLSDMVQMKVENFIKTLVLLLEQAVGDV